VGVALIVAALLFFFCGGFSGGGAAAGAVGPGMVAVSAPVHYDVPRRLIVVSEPAPVARAFIPQMTAPYL
jgi:hypothetical protein